jgi:hypothetical protein
MAKSGIAQEPIATPRRVSPKPFLTPDENDVGWIRKSGALLGHEIIHWLVSSESSVAGFSSLSPRQFWLRTHLPVVLSNTDPCPCKSEAISYTIVPFLLFCFLLSNSCYGCNGTGKY